MARHIPRSLQTRDRNGADRPPTDPDAVVEVTDGPARQQVRIMTASEAHANGKRRARREKRIDKARGTRWRRRTDRRELAETMGIVARG